MPEQKFNLAGARVGCAMTGSFCTFKPVFEAWRALKAAGAELFPIMSFNACSLDTRFYPAKEAVSIFEDISGKSIMNAITQVEPIGPKKLLDLLVIAPCTGNSLAKLANGICDTPVTLAMKSHLRNERPVLIAVSTNDALAAAAKNIGLLMNMKHVYFVPFRQDSPESKPRSCVAHFEMIPESASEALKGRQIQPFVTGKQV